MFVIAHVKNICKLAFVIIFISVIFFVGLEKVKSFDPKVIRLDTANRCDACLAVSKLQYLDNQAISYLHQIMSRLSDSKNINI